MKFFKNFISYRRKIAYLRKTGWYKSMSGSWVDSHCMRFLTRRDIWRMPEDILIGVTNS